MSELVGCVAGVLLTNGLVAGLLWIAGSSRGIPPARLRRLLALALGAEAAGLGGLALARWFTGGSLFDLDTYSRGGLHVRHLTAAQGAVDVLAALWALVCLWYGLSVAGRITGPPPSPIIPPDPGE
jgi:hypothetical protein